MNQGIRNNQGKLQWSQIDFKALEPMVRVLEYGETSVGRDNWKKGLLVRETIESLLRHTFALLAGEDNDQESKQPHIGHILSNAMFISYMLQNRPDMDNRREKEESKGASQEDIEKYEHDRLLEMLKDHDLTYEEWCNRTEGMSEAEKGKVLMSSIPQFWKMEKKEEPIKTESISDVRFPTDDEIEKYVKNSLSRKPPVSTIQFIVDPEYFKHDIGDELVVAHLGKRAKCVVRSIKGRSDGYITPTLEIIGRAESEQNANIGRSYPKESSCTCGGKICGVQPNGEVYHCNHKSAIAHVELLQRAYREKQLSDLKNT